MLKPRRMPEVDTELQIRQAQLIDLASIYAVDPVAAKSDKRERFLAKSIESKSCAIALMKGPPCGYIVFDQSFFGYGFIHLVVVAANHRRSGIASRLIEFIEQICPTEKLFTSTNQSNVIMQNLLEKLGYSRSGLIENVDEGDPELVYFKKLVRD